MPVPFGYAAWMQNHELPVDDEDYEWCAVFIVLAESSEEATGWGGHHHANLVLPLG